MPEIGENREVFGETWDWSRGGDEWSDWFGGTERMWSEVLAPRLEPLLESASTVLEIAPGYGRVTEYLRRYADRLLLVDLNPNCIDACRKRFADATNIEYHVNDGRSLDMIPDGTVDLVVSWDSLVHVELDPLAAYIEQLPRVLSEDGRAWLHHSNAGSIRTLYRASKHVPALRFLVDHGVLPDAFAWRASTVSGAKIRSLCEQQGLAVERSELISWEHGRWLTDCISTIRRAPLADASGPTIVRNHRFGR